jgi:hypothetical protein
MSNPWQQVFEEHREQINADYIAEKYGQHKSDDSEETQALYDLRNKMKNMGKDAVIAYLKRSKMSPERKARLARSLGVSIVGEEFATEGMAARAIQLGLMAGTAAGGAKVIQAAQGMANNLGDIQKKKLEAIKKNEETEIEVDQLDEKITAKTDIGTAIRDFQGSTDSRLAGRSKEERRKAAIAAVLQARRKAEKANEEVELQEEAKILVRVTKEDGSVFQKKIPASALQDYRKRYKTVVVVGSAEGGGGTAKKEAGSNVNEAAKRWWDDDDDGIGYEKGEVSGSFKKKKKKVKKEEYSDWRSDNPDLAEATKAQKSVEGKAHASYEGEDKKKRKKNANESECGCSHEVKEAAEKLAEELGAELIDINEYAGVLARSAIRGFTRTPAPFKIPEPVRIPAPGIKPPTPAPLVPVKPTPAPVPTKPAPKPTKPGEKPVKPETKPEPKKQPKPGTKTDTKVKVDQKTGAIVSVNKLAEPGSKTATLSSPALKPTAPGAPTKPGKPGELPKGGPGGGIRLPRVPMPKPQITDPTAPASTLKV